MTESNHSAFLEMITFYVSHHPDAAEYVPNAVQKGKDLVNSVKQQKIAAEKVYIFLKDWRNDHD